MERMGRCAACRGPYAVSAVCPGSRRPAARPREGARRAGLNSCRGRFRACAAPPSGRPSSLESTAMPRARECRRRRPPTGQPTPVQCPWGASHCLLAVWPKAILVGNCRGHANVVTGPRFRDAARARNGCMSSARPEGCGNADVSPAMPSAWRRPQTPNGAAGAPDPGCFLLPGAAPDQPPCGSFLAISRCRSRIGSVFCANC